MSKPSNTVNKTELRNQYKAEILRLEKATGIKRTIKLTVSADAMKSEIDRI